MTDTEKLQGNLPGSLAAPLQAQSQIQPQSQHPQPQSRSQSQSQSPSTNPFSQISASSPGSITASTTTITTASDKRPVAKRACLACREKKVKCDGEVPPPDVISSDGKRLTPSYKECSNCLAAGIKCVFVRSNRGGRRKKTTNGSQQQSKVGSTTSLAPQPPAPKRLRPDYDNNPYGFRGGYPNGNASYGPGNFFPGSGAGPGGRSPPSPRHHGPGQFFNGHPPPPPPFQYPPNSPRNHHRQHSRPSHISPFGAADNQLPPPTVPQPTGSVVSSSASGGLPSSCILPPIRSTASSSITPSASVSAINLNDNNRSDNNLKVNNIIQNKRSDNIDEIERTSLKSDSSSDSRGSRGSRGRRSSIGSDDRDSSRGSRHRHRSGSRGRHHRHHHHHGRGFWGHGPHGPPSPHAPYYRFNGPRGFGHFPPPHPPPFGFPPPHFPPPPFGHLPPPPGPFGFSGYGPPPPPGHGMPPPLLQSSHPHNALPLSDAGADSAIYNGTRTGSSLLPDDSVTSVQKASKLSNLKIDAGSGNNYHHPNTTEDWVRVQQKELTARGSGSASLSANGSAVAVDSARSHTRII
ncbi:unnamed protein product [Ambrosiozyma monospora]|uniref:Unnamed protein product n=1 Tax=Ambrosiozyma monospora TaxID=43982 RepID=A0ACB5U110_AMBMO|nr:unnamed protein product [Ambrosiozyma monospora]